MFKNSQKKSYFDENTFEGFKSSDGKLNCFSPKKDTLLPLSDGFISEYSEDEYRDAPSIIEIESSEDEASVQSISYNRFQNSDDSLGDLSFDHYEDSDCESHSSFLGFDSIGCSISVGSSHKIKEIINEISSSSSDECEMSEDDFFEGFLSNGSENSFEGFEMGSISSGNKLNNYEKHSYLDLSCKDSIQDIYSDQASTDEASSCDSVDTLHSGYIKEDDFEKSLKDKNYCDLSTFLSCNISSNEASENIREKCKPELHRPMLSQRYQLQTEPRVRLIRLTSQKLTSAFSLKNRIGKRSLLALQIQLWAWQMRSELDSSKKAQKAAKKILNKPTVDDTDVKSKSISKDAQSKSSDAKYISSHVKAVSTFPEMESNEGFYPLDPFAHSIFAPIIEKERRKQYIRTPSFIQVERKTPPCGFSTSLNSRAGYSYGVIQNKLILPHSSYVSNPQNRISNLPLKYTVYYPSNMTSVIPSKQLVSFDKSGVRNVDAKQVPGQCQGMVWDNRIINPPRIPIVPSHPLTTGRPTPHKQVIYEARPVHPYQNNAQMTRLVAGSHPFPSQSNVYTPSLPKITPRPTYTPQPIFNNPCPVMCKSDSGSNVTVWTQ